MANERSESARPVLKRVQPSGRGMQSEHELAAKRAAVESIERRFEHNEKVRKHAARKRTLANFGSIVVGLAVLGGIAYYFTHRDGGTLNLDVDLSNISKTVQEYLPNAVAPSVDDTASAAEREYRAKYAAVAAAFAQGQLAYWKDAPRELKPNNAPAGTVYHALVPHDGRFNLYEIKAKSSIAELSPFGPPVPLTMDEFKKTCGGNPYFIACAGRVFACGGLLTLMDELRKSLVPQ